MTLSFAVGDRVSYNGSGGFMSYGMVTRIDYVLQRIFAKMDPGMFAGEARQFDFEGNGIAHPAMGSSIKQVEPAPPTFQHGDRVTYTGTIAPSYTGKSGVVRQAVSHGYDVTIDGETAVRYFPASFLQLEKPMTIVSTARAAVAALFATSAPSTVGIAARELLAATTLGSIIDAKKKRAKLALTNLGIILPEYRPGTVRAYDGPDFTIEAVTKEPASRLDQALLTAQLRSAGLSQATITRCFAAATVDNKAATSIVVTEK